ncbi:hypothetical protein [Pseudoalteromonas luteoviolacea]|uniref:hypothetical protein n=1 Tax=Pseudoalteromonas luteoviolacea TaxID=43657 RepID=UPI001B39A371|nr:hypothetical protein [Pseudoalteromonas luteoviolacea]MBQ4839018.1 hypothetical protein [Pseudoalteromonas luteoviolacea]
MYSQLKHWYLKQQRGQSAAVLFRLAMLATMDAVIRLFTFNTDNVNKAIQGISPGVSVHGHGKINNDSTAAITALHCIKKPRYRSTQSINIPVNMSTLARMLLSAYQVKNCAPLGS